MQGPTMASLQACAHQERMKGSMACMAGMRMLQHALSSRAAPAGSDKLLAVTHGTEAGTSGLGGVQGTHPGAALHGLVRTAQLEAVGLQAEALDISLAYAGSVSASPQLPSGRMLDGAVAFSDRRAPSLPILCAQQYVARPG